jgi:anti-anti-sigma regulatory factor
MAANEKKNLIGYDPLAWLSEEIETFAEERQVTVIEEAETIATPEFEDAAGKQEDSELAPVSESEISGIEPEKINMEILAEDSSVVNQADDITEADDDIESLIKLDSTLTIQNVGKLYERLKRSYFANQVLEINASHVVSIDTATLQLLVALKKNAVKQEKKIVFSEPSERFIESAELLGLLDLFEIKASI